MRFSLRLLTEYPRLSWSTWILPRALLLEFLCLVSERFCKPNRTSTNSLRCITTRFTVRNIARPFGHLLANDAGYSAGDQDVLLARVASRQDHDAGSHGERSFTYGQSTFCGP
jgi:hypothetical protein